MALLAAAALAAGSGCDRRGELLGTLGPNDGGTGGGPDAGGTSAPRFTTPVLISTLSHPLAQDSDPTFTGDLLELFFTSDRNGTMDIWVSHRATAADPWGTPTAVSELNTFYSEYGPAISLDGLRIWFTTDRDDSPGRIWRALRLSRQSPWGPPYAVAELANAPGGPAKDFAPAVDAVETTFMFGSNRLGSRGYDVYYATRPGGGMPWGTPLLVPGINGPLDDWDPFVAQGGLVVFFTSTRSGGGDIFWAARQSTAEPFPSPQPVTDLNSSAYDSDPTLSVDLTYVVFDSSRNGTSDLYEAHATGF
jgi:hypothetical protein